MDDLRPSQETAPSHTDSLTPSQETALCHLEMLAEMLTGEYKPRQPFAELIKRYAALDTYIRTGQCLAEEEDRERIERFWQLRRQAWQGAEFTPGSEGSTAEVTA
jgi:hypothetical protein